MMEKANDSFAVVTGASTGIGRAIAGELASRRHNLVLNSLPGQGLEDLCRKLESDFGVVAYCAEGDLTAEEGPETLYDFVRQKKLNVDILVNNAGIGYEGPVEGYSRKQIDNMLMLNVRAVTMLTMLFTPGLKTNGRSYILNLSSFGCYLPTAYKSIYLATKSYIFYFTRAIESELKGSTVRTCVAVPSAVMTNVNTRDRIERNGWISKKSALEPEEVASVVIRGMFKGKKVILPGKLSGLFFGLGLIIPEGIMMWMTRRLFRNYRQGWVEA
jgi:short-subunit dehydrogenase